MAMANGESGGTIRDGQTAVALSDVAPSAAEAFSATAYRR